MAVMFWTGASSGVWTTVGNWIDASTGSAPGAAPGTGDTVIFDARAATALTGSPGAGVVLAKVQIKHNCPTSSYIGTPTTPIAAAATSFIVGEETEGGGSPAGCQQICWNLGGTTSGYSGTTVEILKSNQTGLSTSGLEVVQLCGTHSSNTMRVTGACSVGWGVSLPGQAYTVATVSVSGENAKVRLGSGGTLTTINQSGGSIVAEAAFTTLNQIGGKFRTEGTGAITTANVNGEFISNSTGAIATLDVEDNGFADFTKNPVARTVTSGFIHGGGRIDTENGVANSITFTNGVDCLDGAHSRQVNFGQQVTVTPSAL